MDNHNVIQEQGHFIWTPPPINNHLQCESFHGIWENLDVSSLTAREITRSLSVDRAIPKAYIKSFKKIFRSWKIIW